MHMGSIVLYPNPLMPVYHVPCRSFPHCWDHHYYLYAFISVGMGMPPLPRLRSCTPT